MLSKAEASSTNCAFTSAWPLRPHARLPLGGPGSVPQPNPGQLAGDRPNHSLRVVPHGSYPGDSIPAGRHLRKFRRGMTAFAAHRMALHTALQREHELAGAGVTGA